VFLNRMLYIFPQCKNSEETFFLLGLANVAQIVHK